MPSELSKRIILQEKNSEESVRVSFSIKFSVLKNARVGGVLAPVAVAGPSESRGNFKALWSCSAGCRRTFPAFLWVIITQKSSVGVWGASGVDAAYFMQHHPFSLQLWSLGQVTSVLGLYVNVTVKFRVESVFSSISGKVTANVKSSIFFFFFF